MRTISLEINPKISTKVELKSISRLNDDDIINFYVEDENKKNYCYTLLSNLYQNRKIRIVDTSRGKKGVIKSYIDNERKNLKSKNFYILDKDFDDKYPCNHPNFQIDNFYYIYKLLKKNKKFLVWKRYCIENYFIDSSLIAYVLNNLTCIKDIKSEFKAPIRKIFKYVNLLSRYQLKNQLADSTNKLNYSNFIDFKTTNIDILKLVKELRIISKKYENSKILNVKYDYNIIRDINGKRFFELLISLGANAKGTSKFSIGQKNFMNLILKAYLERNKSNNFKRFTIELDEIFKNV